VSNADDSEKSHDVDDAALEAEVTAELEEHDFDLGDMQEELENIDVDDFDAEELEAEIAAELDLNEEDEAGGGDGQEADLGLNEDDLEFIDENELEDAVN